MYAVLPIWSAPSKEGGILISQLERPVIMNEEIILAICKLLFTVQKKNAVDTLRFDLIWYLPMWLSGLRVALIIQVRYFLQVLFCVTFFNDDNRALRGSFF